MYDTHYGLTGRPFQLTPDPRFWFDTATHKKAMAYLGYGLSQGEGFIVVTGDIGAGKTTLVGHLTARIDPAQLNVIKIVSSQIAADDLLRTVCAGLDVDAAGLSKSAMLRAIEKGLHAVARGGRRTLLIVDEVQALPTDSLEELRMLSNFQAGGYALLQIFLLGQPEFRERLQDDRLEQLRQRVIAMHHLGPMEPEEVDPYLAHRLGVVGWTGRPDFDADAVAAIYTWSGGIPRRINQLTSRVMLHGAIEGIDVFTGDDVATVIADLDGDAAPAEAAETAWTPPQPVVADAPEPEPEPENHAEPVAEPVSRIVRPFLVEEAVPETSARPIVVDHAPPPPVAILFAEPVEYVEAEPEPEPAEVAEQAQDLEPVAEDLPEPVTADEDGPEPEADDVVVAEPAEHAEFAMPEAAVAEPAPAPSADDRLAAIEQRLEEQDAALRRVLTLLVDWVEGGGNVPAAADLRQSVG